MVALRLIPCLDVAHGRVVKGVNFVNLRDSGDPVELACRYSDEGADELVFLDIRASVENRNTLVDLVSRTAKSVKIPFTVGGGIDSVSSINDLLRAGADKVSLNSSAVRNPDLISKSSREFGNQCIVIAIDAKRKVNKTDEWEQVVKGVDRVNLAARAMGSKIPAPFMILAFVGLAGVPDYGLTEKGLIDSLTQSFIPVVQCCRCPTHVHEQSLTL